MFRTRNSCPTSNRIWLRFTTDNRRRPTLVLPLVTIGKRSGAFSCWLPANRLAIQSPAPERLSSSPVRLKLLLIVTGLLLSRSAYAVDATADATAKFLAGLPVRNTPLEKYVNVPTWITHATDLDRAWSQLEQRQLSKIRGWAPQALGPGYEDTGPMYYMFSGPDFLYANAFFPNASTYILCGVEPVGPVTNIENIPGPVLGSSLANLRKSLDSVL